jgi:hypothetical protein
LPEDPKEIFKQHVASRRRERWCFTQHELKFPENCFREDPFVSYQNAAGPDDLGVIVLRDGQITNMWGDGSGGVPEMVQNRIDLSGELRKPVYYGHNHAYDESDEEVEDWVDVYVDEEGRFKAWVEASAREVIERCI